jgi:hypothetical protein
LSFSLVFAAQITSTTRSHNAKAFAGKKEAATKHVILELRKTKHYLRNLYRV